MKASQLTLSNLMLKFLVLSIPLNVAIWYDLVTLPKIIISFHLCLSANPGTLFPFLAEERTFSYLQQISHFKTETEKPTYP